MWTVYCGRVGEFSWQIHSQWRTEEDAITIVKALIAEGFDTKVTHV